MAVDAVGTRDVVANEEDGLLTENDRTALTTAIERMVTDKDTLQRFRHASLNKAQQLDIANQATALVGVYEQAIESHKAKKARG